ncbi:hypothetical protein [Peptoniphilus asaccharolyticus]
MIYVSIPVHEKIEIILDQAKNFHRFFPEAMIVFHLSKGADFSLHELDLALKDNAIENVLLNPQQVETKWGSIINAHLENIRYILTLEDAEKVIFHSSNDMLVKDGIYKYVKDRKNIFHNRKINKGTFWWVGKRALKDKAMTGYFNDGLLASQIEGSMYEIAFLEMLLKEIYLNPELLNQELFYPKEEILFSSFAKKYQILSDGLPYIFSEIHRFDRKFFRFIFIFRFFLAKDLFFSRAIKKVLSDVLTILGDYKISISDIEAIRCNNKEYFNDALTLNDGYDLDWNLVDVSNLYGVKRIPRCEKNEVRCFINSIYNK